MGIDVCPGSAGGVRVVSGAAGSRRVIVTLAVVALVVAWSLRSTHSSPTPATPPASGPEFSNPSRYGLLTSARWAYGATFAPEDLSPVPNTNPHPEPQPHRDHPQGLAVTVDGRKVLIALAGSEARPGREVAVFDVVGRKVMARLRVGEYPHAIACHPAGRFAVVLNRFSNYATVIDTVHDAVAGTIPLDFYCERIIFNRAGTKAYVSNRYLNQVLVLDVHATADRFDAKVRPLGGFDDTAFIGSAPKGGGVYRVLHQSCGTAACHQRMKGTFYAGVQPLKAYFSAMDLATPGDPDESVLLKAVRPAAQGGFADDRAGNHFHAGGRVIFQKTDPAYQEVAHWIATARQGPGIPVGNFGSKPEALALSGDERYLYVGNKGTQEISIVDTDKNEEVTGIYTQNVINDLAVGHGEGADGDLLVAVSMGIGFGAAKERDPYGGESGDPTNPAAQYTLFRDIKTTEPLPLAQQKILGRFEAIDGTAATKMGDIQNDVIAIDAGRLVIPPSRGNGQLRYALRANRYEAHRDWVRYTSDSAEILPQDFSGDIPPDLQRVVGAIPAAVVVGGGGDRLFCAMEGSFELVEYLIHRRPVEASDLLEPVAVYPTGLQPRHVAIGPEGSPAAGLVFVSNAMGETLTVVDTRAGTTRDYVVGDLARPFPDTNAERGSMFVHTAVFSVDGDTACASCHIDDTSDGRGWGAGQMIAQTRDGHFVNGGLLGIPSLRNLYATQPFYFEGTHSAFDAQFDDAREHVALEGFLTANPNGDYTRIADPVPAARRRPEHEEIQDKMSTASWGPLYGDLLARRDAMMREKSMRYFGKAFDFRDFQRFIGEFQAAETRLVPNPFDKANPSVARGRLLFGDLGVGCVICHKPPTFTDKGEALYHNKERVLPSLISFTPREQTFTLIGPHYMDTVNGYRRDLEYWDTGRVKQGQGMVTTFPLRGLFDRPFAFLHHGKALSIRETFSTPDHYALRKFKYSPLRGGEEIRPAGREVGFNEHSFSDEKTYMIDTHGGTSHLKARQVQDLENFLLSIE